MNILCFYSRADQLSVMKGSGEFVSIIDMDGFNWSKCPPIAMLKDSIGILKRHYAYRLGANIIVNAGPTFHLIWNLLKPFLPATALAKTYVLNKSEAFRVLDEMLGRENIEEDYGGLLKEDNTLVEEYFSQGYWDVVKVEREKQRQQCSTTSSDTELCDNTSQR